MAELSYLEHLNIEVKQRGSILHSYEYNYTVDKINEIVDNLNTSYEYNKAFPKFTPINDTMAAYAPSTTVVINNDSGVLYPVTSSSNVIVDGEKTLSEELESIKSNISSYSAGFGISINNDEISVDTNAIADNHSIYVNSYGQLVVNNEVVLHDAEKSFTFINENGEWVGDMANVKNYIDENINNTQSYLEEKIAYNTNKISYLSENMYAYLEKFVEYEMYGKEYSLSEEFIRKQE